MLNVGKVCVGDELICLYLIGEFKDVKEFENFFILKLGENEFIYLGDVVKVFCEYVEVLNNIICYN